MTTATVTATYVGTCHVCGTFLRSSEVRNVERYGKTLRADAQCPTCPGYAPRTVFIVQGTVTSTPCSDKCTDAKGVKCECSCGGDHHGETAA